MGNAGEFGDIALKKALGRGVITGPNLLVAGKIIAPFAGQNVVNYDDPDYARRDYFYADTRDEMRKAIRTNIQFGLIGSRSSSTTSATSTRPMTSGSSSQEAAGGRAPGGRPRFDRKGRAGRGRGRGGHGRARLPDVRRPHPAGQGEGCLAVRYGAVEGGLGRVRRLHDLCRESSTALNGPTKLGLPDGLRLRPDRRRAGVLARSGRPDHHPILDRRRYSGSGHPEGHDLGCGPDARAGRLAGPPKGRLRRT